MKPELIIEIKNGGLGDHLFYSHIPRIAKETGAYEKVFISNHSNLRNKAYKELIWDKNPFVDGFTDKEGSYPVFSETRKECNILDEIMLQLGLDDGKRYHEPELYYTPNLIPSLVGKTLYDPNYISSAGFCTAKKIQNYFLSHNIHIDHQMYVREKRALPITQFDTFLKAKTFWDFLDILYSAGNIYCVVTGTATLAAALKKSATVFYTEDQLPMFRHSKNNTYIKI